MIGYELWGWYDPSNPPPPLPWWVYTIALGLGALLYAAA